MLRGLFIFKAVVRLSGQGLHIWLQRLWMPGRGVTFKVGVPGRHLEASCHVAQPPSLVWSSHPHAAGMFYSKVPDSPSTSQRSVRFLLESLLGLWLKLNNRHVEKGRDRTFHRC